MDQAARGWDSDRDARHSSCAQGATALISKRVEHMKRLVKIAATAAALVLVSTLVSTPANAAEKDEFSDIEGEPTSSLTVEATEGGVSTLSNLNSPAGCAGKTDYAHWSELVYAAVHGRTTCTVAVPALGVSTILQKQGWLYWESMLTDHSDDTNSKDSEDAHPHWVCQGWGSQNYRGVSTHWSQEASGRYSATTVGAEKRFSC